MEEDLIFQKVQFRWVGTDTCAHVEAFNVHLGGVLLISFGFTPSSSSVNHSLKTVNHLYLDPLQPLDLCLSLFFSLNICKLTDYT